MLCRLLLDINLCDIVFCPILKSNRQVLCCEYFIIRVIVSIFRKMATMAGSTNLSDCLDKPPEETSDALKKLYPAVNEEETPLPRSWSTKDKFNYIGLSQNNLRVHYKADVSGLGKTHKDAASIRATYPIPASCGIYYFEVKIICKGRDGYMGIGLSVQGVNLNRLPGWDKHSYGYHGDDGHSFCSSGTGQPYGPTFSTGDVIGCCVNLIENTCFYTKNGVNLGIAFRDLPPNLYPTVGLQTPGEIVEANFGYTPFVFDIEEYMRQEWKLKTQQTIERFPVENRKGEWHSVLQRIVSTYLVHHGYSSTAESFARSTGQSIDEELASIKNRQSIQRLVLAGRIGEAIESVHQLYPGLLERNPNLLFMLKCRQFIEMVNGTDSEVRGPSMRSTCSPNSSSRSSPNVSPLHQSSRSHIIANNSVPTADKPPLSPSTSSSSTSQSSSNSTPNGAGDAGANVEDVMNKVNSVMNGSASQSAANRKTEDSSDVDMDTCDSGDEDEETQANHSNGVSNGSAMNGNSEYGDQAERDDDMDTAEANKRLLCGGNQAAIEKMLTFGRELHTMSEKLRQQYGSNEHNKKVLQEAFSLLAYADPWSSPVGHQLNPVQREPVCAALNSAILESHGLPKQPPLELAIGQASECMRLMSKAGVGSCAFASLSDYLH